MDCITNQVISSATSPVLPVETIYHILLLLGPQELILLQRVSKQFRAIINDQTLWRTVYTDAQLPRPPGPFPWQSIKFLQRTLVRSARLAERWTSRPINVLSKHSRALDSSEDCKWVCGRWLIICKRSRQLVSHDFDTGSEQVLGEWDHSWISWSATCCMGSTRGHLLYVGFYADDGHPGQRMKLLEFQADDDSGYLSGPITFDGPLGYPGRIEALRVESGDTPFVLISLSPFQLPDTLIFDTRNHTFYKFPVSMSEPGTVSELPLSHQRLNLHCEVVLTMTHIISFTKGLIIQAYVIPANNQTHELRLSHETTVPQRSRSWTLLRNSVIDPITGSTGLRLLNALAPFERQSLPVCTDFTLPPNSTEGILPILIDTHVVFTMDNAVLRPGSKLAQASPDGHARGWYCASFGLGRGGGICKFSIDATGERCVRATGDPYPVERYGANFDREWLDGEWLSSLDGMRGRTCYVVDGLELGSSIAIMVNLE